MVNPNEQLILQFHFIHRLGRDGDRRGAGQRQRDEVSQSQSVHFAQQWDAIRGSPLLPSFRGRRLSELCPCVRSNNDASSSGRRLNGFLGLSLNDRTILFIVILLDKTVSIG